MSKIQVVKRKAKGFFKPEDIPTIQQTVQDVHDIISNASILLRAFYIDWIDRYGLTKPIILEHHHIALACNVVQGAQEAPVRGKDSCKGCTDCPKCQKIGLFNDLLRVFNTLYDKPNAIVTDFSVSHVIAYSIETLLTAYETNITTHFPKYPKRYITCDLLSKGFGPRVAKKIAGIVVSHYLYDASLDSLKSLDELKDVSIHVKAFKDLFLEKQTVKEKSRAWDIKVHPWLYLAKMVEINKLLESRFTDVPAKYRKLLNPLPFHSSFVPMHIRLDTSGLSQLLMDNKKIEDFKQMYSAFYPDLTLNMKSKADMLSSFEKLVGRKENTKEESGLFATHLWDYMTNLTSCDQFKELYKSIKGTEWMFDNAVVTDGITVSFQIIQRSVFGRKCLTGRKKAKEDVEEEIREPVKVLDHQKVLGCDPGKRDLLAITDGFKTITYTKGQRDQDVYKTIRQNLGVKRKRAAQLEEYETTVLNQCCKRSCDFDTFKGYCNARKGKEDELSKLYSHPVYRQFKFTNHCKTKSSEAKFVNKVFNAFGPSQDLGSKKNHCMDGSMVENAKKEVSSTKDLVISWGNWGKNPNALKGVGPTPGIGLRRRMESWFPTITTNEYLTSQRCPCCHGSRCLKKVKLSVIKRHHLLRCTNDECQSRWWNRNVVGSFNILFKGLHPEAVFGEEENVKRPKKRSKTAPC